MPQKLEEVPPGLWWQLALEGEDEREVPVEDVDAQPPVAPAQLVEKLAEAAALRLRRVRAASARRISCAMVIAKTFPDIPARSASAARLACCARFPGMYFASCVTARTAVSQDAGQASP